MAAILYGKLRLNHLAFARKFIYVQEGASKDSPMETIGSFGRLAPIDSRQYTRT